MYEKCYSVVVYNVYGNIIDVVSVHDYELSARSEIESIKEKVEILKQFFWLNIKKIGKKPYVIKK